MPTLARPLAVALLCALPAACGSTTTTENSLPDASGGHASSGTCSGTSPTTLELTLGGFKTCACFNGRFTLALQSVDLDQGATAVWTSGPVTGCPGQQGPAYLRLVDDTSGWGFGITDSTSIPGSGGSDYAPATSQSCAPFAVAGGGSQAGNITVFCGPPEDENMTWSIVAAGSR